MFILRGRKVITGGQPGVKPAAPLVVANDAANTLQFTATGAIEISINNGAWQDYGGTINVGDVNRPAGYWRARVKAVNPNPASDIVSSPAFTQATGASYKTQINALVDAAYYMNEVLNTSGQPAAEGDIVGTIVDSKGNHNLSYSGEATPQLGRPTMLDGGVEFLNQSNAYFSKNIAVQSLPEEFTLVFRHMPGQGYEAIQNLFGTFYFGFGGNSHLRALANNLYLPPNVSLAYLQVSTIHVTVEAYNGNGTQAKVWYNGALMGTVTTGDSHRRSAIAAGILTNCTEHLLLGMFYKWGKFASDQARTDYLQLINQHYNAGAMPTRPYASNVGFSSSGNNRTCNYTYNGANPENVGAVQYRWYDRGANGGAFTYTLVGTTKTINYADASDLIPTVKVFDNQGNTWRFMSPMMV